MRKFLLTILSLCLLSVAAIAKKPTRVAIQTEYGKIVIELYDNTPKHKANMIKLAKEHFYDSTLFHRVIPNFVIQGGDPDSKHAKPGQALGNGEYGSLIPAEINDVNYHKRGAVGMARDNNPEKASSGCQFYIVTGKKYTSEELDKISQRTGRKFTAEQRKEYETAGGVPHLDGGYTVFGEVVEGMDVVDKISNEKRDQRDRPLKDIPMQSVRVVKKKFLGIF